MAGCDLSVGASETPLTREEADWLLEGDAAQQLAAPSAARTLLRRVRAYMDAADARQRELRGTIMRVTETQRMRSAPVAAALRALGELSLDEQGEVFAAHTGGVTERLRAMLDHAREDRLASNQALVRAQMVVAAVFEDPGVPQEVKARLSALVSRMPAPVELLPAQVNLEVSGEAPFRALPTSDSTLAPTPALNPAPTPAPAPAPPALGDLFA